MNPNDERGFLVEGLMELFDDHYSRLLAEYHKEDDRAWKELFRAVRTGPVYLTQKAFQKIKTGANLRLGGNVKKSVINIGVWWLPGLDSNRLVDEVGLIRRLW